MEYFQFWKDSCRIYKSVVLGQLSKKNFILFILGLFYQNHIYGRSKWKTLMENCWMWMCNFTEFLCLQKFEIMLIFFAIATQCIFREIARLWIAHIYCIVSSIWSGAGDPGGLGGRAPLESRIYVVNFLKIAKIWFFLFLGPPE